MVWGFLFACSGLFFFLGGALFVAFVFVDFLICCCVQFFVVFRLFAHFVLFYLLNFIDINSPFYFWEFSFHSEAPI